MGAAAPWQDEVTAALGELDVLVLNPRRDAWDSSWAQRIDNPQFREQVEWELEAQERASVIAMYFDPNTRAPITLLELGLFARGGRLIVCCPEGYWRKGNVDVVAARYGIARAESLDALIVATRGRLAAQPGSSTKG
ncbi:MAG: nucleoside 2-deoxyribosyltransferase domain-containing protein [Myxococcales bacterium]|nr:nucleoside 2-deoxyribosyltransferase domain-containing protein [Myxococcales bacterium]